MASLHMKPLNKSTASLSTTSTSNPNQEGRVKPCSMNRRSFLRKSLAVGAGTIGAGLLATAPTASAKDKDKGKDKGKDKDKDKDKDKGKRGRLDEGDAAILRFLAAAEIIETDLWQQYNELAGIQDDEVPGGTGNPAYAEAVAVLDEDMAQYIHDNTDDEISHAAFINAFLESKGAEPVNLDQFRTLPSSVATGAQQIGRLTNLMQLTVDTSFWTRYRSDSLNPDFGDTLPQAIPDLAVGEHPAIPRSDDDLTPPDHLQAIANTAGFHFAFIEQGGTSLYASLAQRVTQRRVLRILLSIGGTEIMHFQTWQDKAGNAPPLTDPTTGLVFPDLNANGELTQTNLIMPEPTIFLNRKFPICSIIRPTETKGAATAALNALIADGLFIGQPDEFFALLSELAGAADAARRRRPDENDEDDEDDENAGMEAAAATAATTAATAPTLTVNGGTGSGPHDVGTMFTVTANPPPSGQQFAGWSEDIQILANPLLSTTTATMPSIDVTITATYKPQQ
jgi:Ferritin-like domain/Divergent InlB B-repeat domain